MNEAEYLMKNYGDREAKTPKFTVKFDLKLGGKDRT